jgi:hypothetical protein
VDTSNATTKRCKQCKNDYPADARHFSKAADCKDGLGWICKNCRSLRYYGKPMVQWPPDAPAQLYQVKCRICGRAFGAKHPSAQLCSDECWSEDNRRRSRDFMQQKRADPDYHALDNERHRERDRLKRESDPTRLLRLDQKEQKRVARQLALEQEKIRLAVGRLWKWLRIICCEIGGLNAIVFPPFQ